MIENKTYEAALMELRQEIDEIDNQIISLFAHRMRVVSKVGELKKNSQEKFFIRSNREADMLKKLVKKSGDILPKSTIISIWRKIITAANMHEQPLRLAIHNPKNLPDYGYLLREYYDHSVPQQIFQSAAATIASLEKNEAQIGIFALPQSDDEENWWIDLAKSHPGLKVFAKIPFFEFPFVRQANGIGFPARQGATRVAFPCSEGTEDFEFSGEKNQIQLLAVAAKNAEKSSEDCSLLSLEISQKIPASEILQALAREGLEARILKSVDKEVNFVLVELKGFYLDWDVAIQNFCESKIGVRARILGHFATPIKI
jgi:chorismate mutase